MRPLKKAKVYFKPRGHVDLPIAIKKQLVDEGWEHTQEVWIGMSELGHCLVIFRDLQDYIDHRPLIAKHEGMVKKIRKKPKKK